MPAKQIIPFAGPESKSRSIAVNNQETVNLMAAVKGSGAKAPVVLESIPGLVDLGAIGNGACRTPKMIESSVRGTKDLYGVWGDRLIALGSDGINHTIGELNTSSGTVHIARGRNYVMLTDGANGYTYDGSVFAAITDLDYPANENGLTTHCLYLDGFFIVNDANSDNWYISALEDPTSWNALDFDAAAVAPDRSLALASTESLLWVIGEETAQAYYNSGNSDFPYEIVLGATQEVGILAPNSIAESDDGIFYLGTTPEGGRFVHRIQGQTGSTVSGDEQDQFLATLEDPSTATGFIYKQAGKSFYVLQTGPSRGPDGRDSNTLVYNIRANDWERRESDSGEAWRIAGHGILNNRNIGGSRTSASHYELDLTHYKDAGTQLIRRRRTQIYHNNGHLVDWWEIVIESDGGVGNDAVDNPEIKLRYSDDGGRTWSSWLEEPLGAEGEFEQRAVFRNLGQARARVFEIEVSDEVPFTLISGYAVLEVLRD